MRPATVLTLLFTSNSIASAFSFGDLVTSSLQSQAGETHDLAKRETVAEISLCIDFGGPDAPGQTGCKTLNLVQDQFTAGFEFDKAELNRIVGGPPSSAKILTPGVICGIGSKIEHDVKFFLNFIPHCRGDRLLLNADSYRDFPGSLNDNLGCIACFKSPGA